METRLAMSVGLRNQAAVPGPSRNPIGAVAGERGDHPLGAGLADAVFAGCPRRPPWGHPDLIGYGAGRPAPAGRAQLPPPLRFWMPAGPFGTQIVQTSQLRA